ncbi:MAG: hypothetical protein CL675_11715 [Bdellovibrionaceae bacterium]|nr:hypothetical protein [Pseudobdellovibrionaceae bacterium]|tara:strand:+ start:365 stop:622 length:258 start_codon:yes stop_codon:yes gene_type:complete
MKLPIIKTAVEYIEENSVDHIDHTLAVLEHMSQARGLKDEELDTIGELISNLAGALEVHNSIQNGAEKRQALNDFMQRVLGSIDK